MEPRLLAGPSANAGSESLRDHFARLGPLPAENGEIIDVIEDSGLLGRGGGAFPVARKWRAVGERAGGDARLLVNGAEGEPLSVKDRILIAQRPHLILDGALVAGASVGAREIVVYVGRGHISARKAMARAIAERRTARNGLPVRVRMVVAPDAYVAGEESAAVHFVNDGDARPTTTPPRPFQRGVDQRPTLVQNVETLATVGLIARHGADWYRSVGRGDSQGSTLISVGIPGRMSVREVELGTSVGEIAAATGFQHRAVQAVLLGGYFGSWGSRDDIWSVPLDPLSTRQAGLSFGAGVISFLGRGVCGVTTTARILDYMAGQSAAQCGPCVFGLRAIADAAGAVATGRASDGHVALMERWSGQIVGRGACRHPDGVAGLVASAMSTFADDFAAHARRRQCLSAATGSMVRAAA